MKSRLLILLFCLAPLLSACEDWLTVSSSFEVIAEQQFEDQQGFQDAVVGVYVNLAQQSLYGDNLTWGPIEYFAHNYEEVAGSDNRKYFSFDYNALDGFIDGIWRAAYNTIANINNVLSWEEKRRDVLHPVIDSIICGEMLGLRAMLHFDLVRMHQRGNVAARPEVLNDQCIPYSREFKKESPPRYSYGQTLELIIDDLRRAIKYLEADPVITERDRSYYAVLGFSGFLGIEKPSERSNRMNYYAAKAVLARVLMWRGSAEDRKEALEIAENIIALASGSTDRLCDLQPLNTVTSFDWYLRQTDMRMEWIFALCANNKRTSIGDIFDARNITTSTLYLTRQSVTDIFETTNPELAYDYRYSRCLMAEGSSGNYSILKNRMPSETQMPTLVDPRFMLIRLTEMYYIAAECYATPGETYNKAEAIRLINTIRRERDILEDLVAGALSDEQMMYEILKEYRKEFIGEGVLFYYYKRRGVESIRGYNGIMGDAQYVFPWPSVESSYWS